jgi:heat shock protein HslJ
LTAGVLRGAAGVLLLFGAAASPSGPTDVKSEVGRPAAGVAANRSAPTLEELRNAAYEGVEEAGGSLTLTDGKWEGEPFVEGGASRPSVILVRDLRLVGDLDGDGREEAVVLLAAETGGSGEMVYLAVVRRTGTALENIATAPVGDRVQLRDWRIDGRAIVLEVVQAGEKDAACCPGDLVTRSWRLRPDGLAEGPPTTTGRLSLGALAGVEWVLRAWARGEPAPAVPEVTLKLDGNRFEGGAGCNNYFAPVKSGEQPGSLRVGPVGATRKACPEREMEVEDRFLRQLAGARELRFSAGRLALSYGEKDAASGVMLFERRVAP